MYNFVFDRKSLALLAAGLAFAGGLLFFGGVLVGVSWVVPYEARLGALSAPHQIAAFSAPHQTAALNAAQQTAALTQTAVLAPPEPDPAAPPPAPEIVEEPIAEPMTEPASALPAPPAAPAPALEPLPDPVPAAEPASPPPAPEPEASYAVQVGAFAHPENSQEAMRDLESRGYQPYVESLTNARGHLLHTVRIGPYPDREAAARVASDFRQKERMAAIVQPVGAL